MIIEIKTGLSAFTDIKLKSLKIYLRKQKKKY